MNPELSNKALHKILKWLDPLIVRYCWAAKRWPKRATFHESYFRDVYRVRKFPKLEGIEIEDLIQEMRLFVLDKVRKYRYRYSAPIGGYVSKALYYGIKKLAREQDKRNKLEEVLLSAKIKYSELKERQSGTN